MPHDISALSSQSIDGKTRESFSIRILPFFQETIQWLDSIRSTITVIHELLLLLSSSEPNKDSKKRFIQDLLRKLPSKNPNIQNLLSELSSQQMLNEKKIRQQIIQLIGEVQKNTQNYQSQIEGKWKSFEDSAQNFLTEMRRLDDSFLSILGTFCLQELEKTANKVQKSLLELGQLCEELQSSLSKDQDTTLTQEDLKNIQTKLEGFVRGTVGTFGVNRQGEESVSVSSVIVLMTKVSSRLLSFFLKFVKEKAQEKIVTMVNKFVYVGLFLYKFYLLGKFTWQAIQINRGRQKPDTPFLTWQDTETYRRYVDSSKSVVIVRQSGWTGWVKKSTENIKEYIRQRLPSILSAIFFALSPIPFFCGYLYIHESPPYTSDESTRLSWASFIRYLLSNISILWRFCILNIFSGLGMYWIFSSIGSFDRLANKAQRRMEEEMDDADSFFTAGAKLRFKVFLQSFLFAGTLASIIFWIFHQPSSYSPRLWVQGLCLFCAMILPPVTAVLIRLYFLMTDKKTVPFVVFLFMLISFLFDYTKECVILTFVAYYLSLVEESYHTAHLWYEKSRQVTVVTLTPPPSPSVRRTPIPWQQQVKTSLLMFYNWSCDNFLPLILTLYVVVIILLDVVYDISWVSKFWYICIFSILGFIMLFMVFLPSFFCHITLFKNNGEPNVSDVE